MQNQHARNFIGVQPRLQIDLLCAGRAEMKMA
jgi:hypothetical protein